MKVHFSKKINYYESDREHKLKLSSLINHLQEVAIKHSEQVGLGAGELQNRGIAWVLQKIGLQISEYPQYSDQIKVVTWARGTRGYKAYRDFLVYSGDTQIVAASSVWFCLDIHRKRIRRIPNEFENIYTIEPDAALGDELENWTIDDQFIPKFSCDLTTRSADYDSNGHINNAIYFDFVDTLLCRYCQKLYRIRRLNIQFLKEIDINIETITAGLQMTEHHMLFKIFNDKTCYARGDFVLGN